MSPARCSARPRDDHREPRPARRRTTRKRRRRPATHRDPRSVLIPECSPSRPASSPRRRPIPRDHGAPRHCRPNAGPAARAPPRAGHPRQPARLTRPTSGPAFHHRFLRRPGTPGPGITQDGHIAGAGTRQHVAGAIPSDAAAIQLNPPDPLMPGDSMRDSGSPAEMPRRHCWPRLRSGGEYRQTAATEPDDLGAAAAQHRVAVSRAGDPQTTVISSPTGRSPGGEGAVGEHPWLLDQRGADGVTMLWTAARRGRLTLVR